MDGHLRTVDTIAIGYAPYTEPSDPDVFWLLPVWHVKGGCTTDTKRAFTLFYDVDGSMADDGIKDSDVVFEGQQGNLIDSMDSRKNQREVTTMQDDLESLQLTYIQTPSWNNQSNLTDRSMWASDCCTHALSSYTAS